MIHHVSEMVQKASTCYRLLSDIPKIPEVFAESVIGSDFTASFQNRSQDFGIALASSFGGNLQERKDGRSVVVRW